MASSRAESSKFPSGNSSTATTRSRLRESGKRSQMHRQHAHAKRRQRRSLTFAPAGKAPEHRNGVDAAVPLGLGHALLLAQEEVDYPATFGVNTFLLTAM